MSLKTIAVLDEADLKDGQMKEVAFEGEGKVLVYKLADKIHATSAFCTHYGAPLAKGVLTADARVVCPWHGACFNVCTGDIEDAPAPAALHSFRAHVQDGKIHVTADPRATLKAQMSRPPTLAASGPPPALAAPAPGVVIVGGGSGALHAVEALREHGYPGPLTLLSREPHAPIDRTKLSKALVTDPAKIEWRTPAELKIRYGATLRTGVAVTRVDTAKKEVTLGESEAIPYESLILAPGGTPRRLPIPGVDAPNVFTFRGIDDAQKVDAAAQEGKNAVVIGSSFISMELVGALAKRKLASLHVVGMESVPFEGVLGKEVGAGLMKYHAAQGVTFHMSASVSKIATGEDGAATGVVINDSETLPADLVVLGVGVAPATQFLKDSGFALEKDGGVRVDEYLRVAGAPGVFAIGDIAHVAQPGGDPRRIEHWNVAGNHGRAVGRTIALEDKGAGAQPFVKVPVFWSAQGQQLRYCGAGAGWDDVIIKGDPGELKFIAYYLKGNKVIAVCTMQHDPVVSKASELLRLGLMPTPDELRGGKSVLDVDISTSAAKLA